MNVNIAQAIIEGARQSIAAPPRWMPMLLKQGDKTIGEIKLIHPDGAGVWMRFHAVYIQDGHRYGEDFDFMEQAVAYVERHAGRG